MSVQIETFKPILPKIYGYITPNDSDNDGLIKIGYTTQKSVEQRIDQQTQTAHIKYKVVLKKPAIFVNTAQTFTDHDFHKYLEQKGYKRIENSEWFEIDKDTLHAEFDAFANKPAFEDKKLKYKVDFQSDYTLREEQTKAVNKTIDYFESHPDHPKMLWNAKPRFGKTLTAYDLVRQMHLQNVLILTNRPSVGNSWYNDFYKFIGWQTDYKFVTDVDSLIGLPEVYNPQDFVDSVTQLDDSKTDKYGIIAFESLQNVKGANIAGGKYDKLNWLFGMNWDLLIIDEAHEGAETDKAEYAFDAIKHARTLCLTGTPFKILANNEFDDDQIFNYSYKDEQERKHDWESEKESNPYAQMPTLSMYTYQMSDAMLEKVEGKVDINGEDVKPAFDLNEFFRVDDRTGQFVYGDDIDVFLDTLTTNKNYPFSTDALRNELRHTFWVLGSVPSTERLADKLKKHPVFKNYKIINVAGKNGETEGAYKKVTDTIKDVNQGLHNDFTGNDYIGTITLTVHRMNTGVTVPEWTGVLMLSSMKSATEYIQTAFRVQNPYTENRNGNYYQKENAYIFDFDPARSLVIFNDFATQLNQNNHDAFVTEDERKESIRQLLNYLPVLSEDKNSEMSPIDAEQVMTIPIHYQAREVVKHGFMDNFLFANIGHIFSAPQAVNDLLSQMPKAKEEHDKHKFDLDKLDTVDSDENGNPDISNEIVINKEKQYFGNKKYAISDETQETVNNMEQDDGISHMINTLTKITKQDDDKNIWKPLKENSDVSASDLNDYREKSDKQVKHDITRMTNRFQVAKTIADKKLNNVKSQATDENEIKQAQNEHDQAVETAFDNLKNEFLDYRNKNSQEKRDNVTKQIETDQTKKKINDAEKEARDHLRGFTRTIPAFLMAFGDKDTTLATFEQDIDDATFKEVAGITKKQFIFLRDGGSYFDEASQTEKHFKGHLFNESVFDQAVQEFFAKKEALKNYFDSNLTEDIFDYIPNQKTNQIFTPKRVVLTMIDDLEKECPDIFDNPNTTFADLYVKSGLYIAEIVKRLYQSEKIKEIFPNDNERLLHILNHQVFMLAPTKIIYRIATNFVLGFNEDLRKLVDMSHFKCADSAEAAKDGKLQELVDKEFGEK